VSEDGSDSWRLDTAVDLLQRCVSLDSGLDCPLVLSRARLEHYAEDRIALASRGGVGVIPTDTMYALVCDINNATAVDALYRCVPLHSVVGGISSGAPLAQPWAGFAQHQGYESQKAAQHPLPRLL